MSFEVNPADGQPVFCVIETGDFKIETMADVAIFWSGMVEICEELYDERGFLVYPIVEFPE